MQASSMTNPLWTPSATRIERSHVTAFIRHVRDATSAPVSSYADLEAWSISSPAEFWQCVWKYCGVIGEPGEIALSNGDRMPGANWFPRSEERRVGKECRCRWAQ